jgi:CPA1 family monovalent cation:H+ antiporter
MLSPWNNRLDTTVYYNENDRNSRYHRLYRQVPNQKFDQSLFFSLQSAKFNPQVYFELLATAAIFEVSTVLLLLCVVTLLAFWTRNWSVPYPTIMVLVGGILALVPGLPDVQLTPDIVFLVFLPPLLYAAAWQTNLREFVYNLRPITMLALGLVLVTTMVVAWVTKFFVPEMPWAAAFALGAIISPPDAIAATSITQRLRVPKRIVVILEGESLLNDASGLVAYRLAVAVAAGELFSWQGALSYFVIVCAGGLAIGCIVGRLVMQVHKRLDDPVIETVCTLMTPYAAYIVSESIHCSGVLACVCAGLLVRSQAIELFSAPTRLHATAVWESVVFVLTGLTFIFIGLGLRSVVVSIRSESNLGPYLWTTLAVLVATVVVRLAWIFPAAWLPRLLIPGLKSRDPIPPASHLLMIGWTGMRGVVSLAAAMALPSDFPFRNMILFVVFGVILGTLVIQGISLPFLVRALGIAGGGRSGMEQEIDARLALLAEANLFLEMQQSAGMPSEEVEYLRTHFRTQSDAWLSRLGLEEEEGLIENQSGICQRTYLRTLHRQRHRLHQMARDSLIDESTVQKLERELDMEESRLTSVTRKP